MCGAAAAIIMLRSIHSQNIKPFKSTNYTIKNKSRIRMTNVKYDPYYGISGDVI